MVIDPDQVLIEFSFQVSEKQNPNISTVYAESYAHMDMFLKQHGFMNNEHDAAYFHNMGMLRIVPRNQYQFQNTQTGLIIKPFKLRSNFVDTLYTIFTTDDFISYSIERVCQDLIETLSFGEAMFAADVGFIKTIVDTMEILPKVEILDINAAMNNDIHYEYSKDFYNAMAKRDSHEQRLTSLNENKEVTDMILSEKCKYHDHGGSYVFEAFFEESFQELTQPITIEAYVRAFASLLTEGEYV
jgi:hypothetical protein